MRDRIVGRYLAEDILDNDGNICYHINDYVTEDMADQISSWREKVKTVPYSIAKPKSAFAVNVMAVIWLQVEKLKLAKLLVLLLLNPLVNLVLAHYAYVPHGGVAGDDITQGLPRVEELFEARKPKHPGLLTENAGTVHIGEENGIRKVTVTSEDGEQIYTIPYGSKLAVTEGMVIAVGDRLTEGSLNPHDILRISGVRATQRYLVQQVLGVYKSQGVEINDKHIEVMVRQDA